MNPYLSQAKSSKHLHNFKEQTKDYLGYMLNSLTTLPMTIQMTTIEPELPAYKDMSVRDYQRSLMDMRVHLGATTVNKRT